MVYIDVFYTHIIKLATINKHNMKHFLCTIIFLTASISSIAQEKTDVTVKSINGIIDELLDQITIEKGEKMDTIAIRNLFHPSAIFTVADVTNAETVSLNDFLILLKDPYYEQGLQKTGIVYHLRRVKVSHPRRTKVSIVGRMNVSH